MSKKTANLCDQYGDQVQVVEPMFGDFGGEIEFFGEMHTIKVFEDNLLIRAALEKPGHGKVLVVDGAGSMRCALVGGNMATLAAENGWQGIVVHGCIRDSEEIAAQRIGLKALGTHPRRSTKLGVGEDRATIQFGGVRFASGDYLYADEDGVVVASHELD